MLRHNLLLIYRNFKRFKSTFFINLTGLSSGLACAIFIYLWVADEISVDKFHEKDSQLFQVMTNQNRPDGIVTLPDGPALLAETLVAEMPEIEHAVGRSSIDDGALDEFTISIPGKNIGASGQFVGADFFKMFSYGLIAGDRNNALADKNAIVLSEKLAMKLFGTTENVIGKMVEWQIPFAKKEVLVSGIFKDVPLNSSYHFDFLLSYEVFKDLLGEGVHWGNHNAIVYLQLKKNTNLEQFNKKIENLIKKRAPNTNLTIFAKPYSDNYLHGKYENGKIVGGRITYVKLFSIIAVFIVLIACINFMNLTTAKASRRIKEIGIKKAVGAGRRTLIAQYLGESMLVAFLSLAIAVLIVDVSLPQFNNITGKHLSLDLSASLVFSLLAITVFTGLVSGSYPALYLSRFSPAIVLKGKFNTSTGEQWARKGLVVFQFTISIIFIISVWVIYKQLAFVQTKHLGYEKDNIIYLKMEGKVPQQREAFINEVKSIPGVVNASSMWGSIMGLTSFTTGDFDWEGRNDDEVIQFEHLGVDFDMIELLGIQMAAGRSFSRSSPSDTSRIILNEAAIKMMGVKDPVGKTFGLWGNKYEIVGIAKNFHFKSLHEAVKPFFLRVTPNDFNKVLVKIEAGKETETIGRIKNFYRSFNPGFAFNYNFLDSEYQALYSAEQKVATLSQYFAGLAILISCLGLFGLASFTAERRLKEIGIRKVMGSSVAGIVYLLSSDFNKIVLSAIIIALPLSYFGTKSWLNNFAYRIDLEWWYFPAAGLVAFAIAWVTVGMQAYKAARVNPTKCLRDE
jgi:ABC-type antimicrobial peptide transport system permease subunit